ncbi:MAG: hypothetical protein ABI969_05665 [bacterium]
MTIDLSPAQRWFAPRTVCCRSGQATGHEVRYAMLYPIRTFVIDGAAISLRGRTHA